MDDHRWRLVDDDKVFVFEKYIEWNILGTRTIARRRRQIQLDLLPALYTKAWFDGFATYAASTLLHNFSQEDAAVRVEVFGQQRINLFGRVLPVLRYVETESSKRDWMGNQTLRLNWRKGYLGGSGVGAVAAAP